MMSRGPNDFTEEELLRISRTVDPSTSYQRVEILIGSKAMMVSAARDHCMFRKYMSINQYNNILY